MKLYDLVFKSHGLSPMGGVDVEEIAVGTQSFNTSFLSVVDMEDKDSKTAVLKCCCFFELKPEKRGGDGTSSRFFCTKQGHSPAVFSSRSVRRSYTLEKGALHCISLNTLEKK
jgi:hypothetical protein